VVAPSGGTEAVECRCTAANLHLFNDTKSVSGLKRLNGDIVQKGDGQTNKKAKNKQTKIEHFTR